MPLSSSAVPSPSVELGPAMEPVVREDRPLFLFIRNPRIMRPTIGPTERVEGIAYQYVSRDEIKRIISELEHELSRVGL